MTASNPYGPKRSPSGTGCGATDIKARIDHDRNLVPVFERFEQNHLKLINKMKFLVRNATFMDHVITTDGVQLNPITVQALIEDPTQGSIS